MKNVDFLDRESMLLGLKYVYMYIFPPLGPYQKDHIF